MGPCGESEPHLQVSQMERDNTQTSGGAEMSVRRSGDAYERMFGSAISCESRFPQGMTVMQGQGFVGTGSRVANQGFAMGCSDDILHG